MIQRIFCIAVIPVVISLALVACSSPSEPTLTVQRPSPAVVPAAPTDVTERVARILGVGATEGNGATGLPPCPDDAPITTLSILNQDLAGSGEYAFDPNELTVKVGDCVEFTVTAETEFHTFTVEELGIDEVLNAGETITFEGFFQEPGEFRLICIPHQANGMVGTITVQ